MKKSSAVIMMFSLLFVPLVGVAVKKRRRRMKKSAVVGMMFCLLVVLLAVITTMQNASAESLSSSLGVVTYPSKGQSAQQQNKDEGRMLCLGKEADRNRPGCGGEYSYSGFRPGSGRW